MCYMLCVVLNIFLFCTEINSDVKYICNFAIVMMFCTDFNSDKEKEIMN